jgi:hypothetical protein
MSDQISPSRTSTPPLDSGRRRAGPERPANRAVGAAIVAGGLALSVSLYPLPGAPRLLDPFQPEQATSTQSAKVVESTFLNVTFSDFSRLKLPDLVKLVALNHDFPAFGTDRLLNLVTTYGLPDVVKSLQLLDSLRPLGHSFPGFSGGGGGGASDVPREAWSALMILLEFLEQNPPAVSGGGGLWDVITNVFPKLALSLGIPPAPAAPPPEAHLSALAAAPVFTPIEAPNLAPPDPPVSGFAAAPVPASVEPAAPASVEPAAPASVEPAAPASVEPTVPAPTEASVSVPVEAPVSPPDPPSVTAPDPHPPSSDPPSSPGGGTDAGSAGGSGGGSAGGSGGGSAGGSGGGSAGSSGGGSAGGSGGGSAAGSSGGSPGGE